MRTRAATFLPDATRPLQRHATLALSPRSPIGLYLRVMRALVAHNNLSLLLLVGCERGAVSDDARERRDALKQYVRGRGGGGGVPRTGFARAGKLLRVSDDVNFAVAGVRSDSWMMNSPLAHQAHQSLVRALPTDLGCAWVTRPRPRRSATRSTCARLPSWTSLASYKSPRMPSPFPGCGPQLRAPHPAFRKASSALLPDSLRKNGQRRTSLLSSPSSKLRTHAHNCVISTASPSRLTPYVSCLSSHPRVSHTHLCAFPVHRRFVRMYRRWTVRSGHLVHVRRPLQ